MVHISYPFRLKEKELFGPFQDIEMAIIPVLGLIEVTGLGFDSAVCTRFNASIEARMALLQEKAYDLAGREFSLTNPQSVSHVLFEVLKLPHPSESAGAGAGQARKILGSSGRRPVRNRQALSTSKAVLLQLNHPIANLVLEWRKLARLQTTVIFQLKRIERLCSDGSYRLFISCNTFTATGRIAVHDPNLQNLPKTFTMIVPVDKAFGSLLLSAPIHPREVEIRVALRDTIAASSGMVLLSADYCQLEMRILAHLSQDPGLLRVLNGHNDVFRMIASEWLEVPVAQVTPRDRQNTKTVCYGIVYGMGPGKLAMDSNICIEEATALIASFRRKFPTMTQYINQTTTDCRVHGYVLTMSKRRYVPSTCLCNLPAFACPCYIYKFNTQLS